MSWNLLERFIESDHFNNDPSLSVAYLSRYADHVGIHYVLCTKLRQFAYEEIEFFLPQLCHLLISVDNESMALEEFIIDLCEESVNGALLTFWLFQTYLHDLSSNPLSPAFTTCRRIYNKVQRIVFGASDAPRRERIKENVLPVTLLSSLVLAAVATPWLPAHAGPLAVAQSRRPRPAEDVISDAGEAQKVGVQRSHTTGANYFRSETQFLTALEDISNRLVIVPKPARLSALRAELALIAQDLPAEVDIPVICPAVLEDGSAARSKHHRIVRINPAEATSLNSAERVPYLLMLEVLREDFDFDPDSDTNQDLLSKLMSEKGAQKRRLFDITEASREEIQAQTPVDTGPDSVFEPANGDLGSSQLGANTAISSRTAMSTPRTSDMDNSRSNSPSRRKLTINSKSSLADQSDVSALATHMRTAAQMLAQLETSGAKRPKPEVAAIKAKIIASMQTLEEQSFLAGGEGPGFDSLIGNASALAATAEEEEFEDGMDGAPDPGSSSGAGAARMENDQATGGVMRRGDRDDPSAATFGEEWNVKKERIRRSSPYGWMKNWDLVSVIVKTGADLRQEAFACQLIQVCSKVWEAAGTDVWIKNMRILVTGESSGLIETITNGVSLHSLKRSLTLASIAAGTNPRKRIASLKDHFLRAFGEEGTEAYDRGVDAFVRSLAAYSMVSYILQLKDRHNGNILIDNAGHVVHIDFGFMLSNSPGNMGFEAAPFKLTHEYVEVMGGTGGAAFDQFKQLCKEAFLALRKESERIVTLVELMGKESKMPCFAVGVASVVAQLRARFVPGLSREEVDGFVDELVQKSVGSYYTRLYDTFQYRTQGIY
ncbi:phosphatidylinositol 4-kinase PIK1a [Rhizodiscina lignyota]|uniref:1-phosphatidylinositol 4-kinase n=1 Tax=Rhizodiscina lignyota TaxID=1504668 RepID=A0A9P4IM77_9PEZI|nr:phosphatidylinositol 4-kinase PIK1a [Rhizodiscina lignyota]